MPHPDPRLVRSVPAVAVTACTLLLGGCSQGSNVLEAAEEQVAQPAAVHESDGHAWVTYSKSADRLLGIRLAPVRPASASGGDATVVVPFSALLYDPNGATWVYVSPRERTYERRSVVVDRIAPHRVYLRSGPPVGTRVVTVGGAELLGTEIGVGEE